MNNLLTELQNYFDVNSREEILRVWDQTERFDSIGMTACDFLLCSKDSFSYKEIENVNNKQNLSSKFSSGFFLNYI